MPQPNYITAADTFDSWRDNVLTGSPPVLYPIGSGALGRIEIGPKLVTLFGGGREDRLRHARLVDALRLTPTLADKSRTLQSIMDKIASKAREARATDAVATSACLVKRNNPLTTDVNGLCEVERRRVELPTSALRTQRSPN